MNGRRRTDIALMTGSSAVQAAGAALSALLATVLLGPQSRGVMVVGLTIGGIAAVLAGLGTGAALRSRLPGAADVDERRALIVAYTWWSVAATALSAVLAVLASASAAIVIDPALGRVAPLGGIALATAAQTAVAQQNDAWFAAGRFAAGSAWAAAASLSALAGLVTAAFVHRGLVPLLVGQAAGTAVVAALAQHRLRRSGLAALRCSPRRTLAELWRIVRVGAPVLGTTLGFVVALRADRLVLGVVAGTTAVSLYSLAATLGEMPRLLPGSVGQVLLRDVALVGSAAPVRRARVVAFGLTTAASVVVAAVGWLLIVPVFGSEFGPARPVLVLLLAAEVCFVPYGLATRGLIGGGWTGAAGRLGGAGGLAAVALFAIAVPLWTMVGAGVASLVLYLALSVIAWRMLVRRLGMAAPRTGDPVPVAVGSS